MDVLPTLPAISDADLVLAIYTHESLSSSNDDSYGDPKRLAQLGEHALEQAIAYHFFMKKPVLSADDIEVQKQLNTPDFPGLLHSYSLRHKIRCAPEYSTMIDTPEGARNFFQKYIGAIYLQSGMGAIQEWVSQLIEPGCQTPLVPTLNTQGRPTQPPNFSNFQIQPPPPPPTPMNQPPPPPPSYYSQGHPPPPPPPPAMAVPNNNFQILAQFNMTAHQRGYTVSYPARSEGPHHTPIWHVQCCLNGEVRGEGSGKNQKQAKEMAARQAWISMGWGHLPDQ